MAPSLLTGGPGLSAITLFEIRLDQPNVVFTGDRQEAADQLIKGTVVLCLSDSIRLHHLKMKITGKSRVAWYKSRSGVLKEEKRKFLTSSWDIFIPVRDRGERLITGGVLEKGNYDWAFEYIIKASLPETVQGLPDSWVVYKLKATLERPHLQHTVYVRKHVRAIRTLSPSDALFSMDATVEGDWNNKLKYIITSPSKAVLFGTTIRIDFTFFPLLQGLKIGDISISLQETLELSVESGKKSVKTHTRSRNAVTRMCRVPVRAAFENAEGQKGFRFRTFLPIPKSLKECLQTVRVPGIKNKHNLNFFIKLINPPPEEHTSEVFATVPIYVFLSPNMPIDENDNLISPTLQRQTTETVNRLAPPLYGEHQLDQIYREVDLTADVTPGGPSGGESSASAAARGSGMTAVVPAGGESSTSATARRSPAGIAGGESSTSAAAREIDENIPFAAPSRTPSESMDNLSSVGSWSSSSFLPDVMQSRPRNLDDAASSRFGCDRQNSSGSSGEVPGLSASNSKSEKGSSFRPLHMPLPATGSSGSSGGKPCPSGPESSSNRSMRRELLENPTIMHIEYSVEDLAKVPSYRTAANARPTAPINTGLPDYQTAIHTPEPPVATPQPPPPQPPPQSPSQVHDRSFSEARRFLQPHGVDQADDAVDIDIERRSKISRVQNMQ